MSVELLTERHKDQIAGVLSSYDRIIIQGTPTIWAARYLHKNGKRRLLGSFTHGSMANALPQAIGAQVTYPSRQVTSLDWHC